MTATAPVATATPAHPMRERLRFDRLDALRGIAIVWMAAFHFGFDLNYFGFIHQNFHRDPFWTVQRACIVTLFMFCVGAGQGGRFGTAAAVGALLAPLGADRRLRGAGLARLVADVPEQLHQLRRPARHRRDARHRPLHGVVGRWRWPLGLVAIMLPRLVSHPFFESRWTNGVGLVTHLPVTEDYAPVLPWLGVVWWGAGAATWLLAHRRGVLAGAAAARRAAARRPRPLEFDVLHGAPAGLHRPALGCVATSRCDDARAASYSASTPSASA